MAEPTGDPRPRVITPNPGYRSAHAFEGWGTSLVWFAHATGHYPDGVREELYQKVFGPDGLRLSVARYNIGGGNASDVDSSYLRPGGAVPGWWNPDLPGVSSRLADRTAFLTAWDPDDDACYDFEADPGQRWWLERLARDGVINRWEAFSNSPPYFMTVSGYVSGGLEAEADQLLPEAVDKFTGYLVRVAEHLERSHGMSFHTIDPMNEPNVRYWMTFVGEDGSLSSRGQEGAQMNPALQAAVIESLRRRLDRRDTSTSALLSAPDETKPTVFLEDWEGWTPAAREAVDQLNVHTYETDDRVRVRDLAKAVAKPLWMSEVDGHFGTSFDPADIEHGLGLAARIVGDLRELEPSSWVFWQPIEDLYNMEVTDDMGWGSVFIDLDLDAQGHSPRRTGDPTAVPWRIVTNTKFDTARNFTRYIRPGDQQIATDDPDTVSFVGPDGSRATVVHVNAEDSDGLLTLDLTRFGAWSEASVTPVVTTSPASGDPLTVLPAIAVDADGAARLRVPARSVITLLVSGVRGVATDAVPPDAVPVRITSCSQGSPLASVAGSVVTKEPDETDPSTRWTLHTLGGAGTNRRTVLVTDSRGAALTAGPDDLTLTSPPTEPSGAPPEQRWILSSLDGRAYSMLSPTSVRQIAAGPRPGPVSLEPGSVSSSQGWFVAPLAD